MEQEKKVIKIISGKRNERVPQLLRLIGTVDINGKGTTHELAEVDPFILLDDGASKGKLPFGKHPHQGFVAVSYLLTGKSKLWDNHNITSGIIEPGGVFYLYAGRGIVHDEDIVSEDEERRMLQMWINVPEELRLGVPSAQIVHPSKVPEVKLEDGSKIRVLIGEVFGAKSPINPLSPVTYLHLFLNKSADIPKLPIDPKFQGFFYVIRGEITVGENAVGKEGQVLVLEEGNGNYIHVKNSGDGDAEVILAAGLPIKEPWVKLLGHDGALIRATREHAEQGMKLFESDKDAFGAK